MTEKLIFRCEVSTDDKSVHVQTEHGEKLDITDMMLAHAYTAAVDKTTEALKVIMEMGRC